jgi:hypothetical protein
MGVRNECHLHLRISRRLRDEMKRAAEEEDLKESEAWREAAHAWLEARRRKASSETDRSQNPKKLAR